jgi:hypothetical protein
MYTRLSRMHHVRSGAFFELDPVKQDFIVRDVFRQTLGTDCISVIETQKPVTLETESKPEKEEPEKEDIKPEDDIYPDDSISRVMERRAHSVAESGITKVSHVSEFRMPKAVRRVHITDEDQVGN